MLVEFCLPVKDEENILAANLQRVLDFCDQANFQFDWKIIGIINASTDKTADIFWEFKNKYPNKIEYIEISSPGKGRALRTYWNQSQADILSYFDIDLAVSLEQLPLLIKPLLLENVDLVIGSRLLSDSRTNRSRLREITSRSFNFLVNLILPNKVADLQCGFKAIKATPYKKISPFLKDDYWLFDSEIILLCQHFSYRIKEIPVNWDENRYAKRQSKVKIVNDLGKFLKGLFCLWLRLFFVPKN